MNIDTSGHKYAFTMQICIELPGSGPSSLPTKRQFCGDQNRTLHWELSLGFSPTEVSSQLVYQLNPTFIINILLSRNKLLNKNNKNNQVFSLCNTIHCDCKVWNLQWGPQVSWICQQWKPLPFKTDSFSENFQTARHQVCRPNKTLPEVQRTQKFTPWLNWPHGSICISCIFGHQMAPLAIIDKFGHQMAPLALVHIALNCPIGIISYHNFHPLPFTFIHFHPHIPHIPISPYTPYTTVCYISQPRQQRNIAQQCATPPHPTTHFRDPLFQKKLSFWSQLIIDLQIFYGLQIYLNIFEFVQKYLSTNQSWIQVHRPSCQHQLWHLWCARECTNRENLSIGRLHVQTSELDFSLIYLAFCISEKWQATI